MVVFMRMFRLLNPWVIKRLFHSDPSFRVNDKHFGNQILAVWSKIGRHLELARFDLAKHLFWGISIERHGSVEQLIEGNSKRPNVTLFVVLFIEDLRRDIVWRSSNFALLPLIINNQCETKVNESDLAVSSEHDVFWLDVPVDNILRMAMLKSSQQFEELQGYIGLILFFRILCDGFHNFSAGAEFHDEVNVLLVIVSLIVGADVWVIYGTHKLDFTIYAVQFILVHFGLVHNFDGHLHCGIFQVCTEENLAERSSAQNVFVDLVLFLELGDVLSTLR